MTVVDQIFYDIMLNDKDNLGEELHDIISIEQKQNKKYQIIVHQVIQVDIKHYTVILNLVDVDKI